MKVILKETVPKLGNAGDIKEVRMGFGFNFLLPRGLAELATKSNVKRVLQRVETLKKKREGEARQLAATIKKLKGVIITIGMKSQDGKLFGSVGSTLIVEALKKQGFNISEEYVVLAKPIKKVGSHVVILKAGDAEETLTVHVVAE